MPTTAPVLLILSLLTSSQAFMNVPWTRQGQRLQAIATKINGLRRDDMPVGDDDSYFDVEQVRRRLEAMMGAEGDNPRDDFGSPVLHRERPLYHTGNALPEAPLLTAISKERRVAELQLLSRLHDSDEAMDELWSLWFSERGPYAADELHDIEDLTAEGPRGWGEAEERLRDLIGEHGVYFVEPVNRLATLLFLQGRLEESKELCATVLQVKPWHFGALSGIVMVCAGLGDPSSARQWAARRLPPIQPTGTNKRRHEWVARAVNDATKSLLEAEKRVKKAFGEPDERHPPREDLFEENVWQ